MVVMSVPKGHISTAVFLNYFVDLYCAGLWIENGSSKCLPLCASNGASLNTQRVPGLKSHVAENRRNTSDWETSYNSW